MPTPGISSPNGSPPPAPIHPLCREMMAALRKGSPSDGLALLLTDVMSAPGRGSFRSGGTRSPRRCWPCRRERMTTKPTTTATRSHHFFGASSANVDGWHKRLEAPLVAAWRGHFGSVVATHLERSPGKRVTPSPGRHRSDSEWASPTRSWR